jgi:flagellar biosynthesis/type III secretory pathway M-ring protein FliF/YscJ
MAKEVDEQTLRTREMVEQLGSMVTEDPETAAQLVERWITRDA